MFTVPVPGPVTRTITVLYGLVLFLWLSPEESSVWVVTVLGWVLAGLASYWFLGRTLGGREVTPAQSILAGILIGAVVGLTACLTTTSLMFFKNSLHAHSFPDFPLELLLAVLRLVPNWASAGGLAGLGTAFIGLLVALRGERKERNGRNH